MGLGVIAHLLFLLFTTDATTLDQLKKLKYPHLITISILAMLPWAFHAMRMMLWTRFIHHPLSFKDCISVIVANDLGSALTPTVVGGGPVKFAMLKRKGLDATKSSFIVLLSGTEDAIFYLIGGILATYYVGDTLVNIFENIIGNTSSLSVVIILISALVLLRLFKVKWWIPLFNLLPISIRLRLGNWSSILAKALREISANFVEVFKRGKLRFVLSLSLLIMQWLSKFSILMVLLTALGVNISYFDILIHQWIIWMSMLFIPTPGASGGAEAAFLLMFKNTLSGEAITLIVSTWRFFTYYFIVILSIILFQLIGVKKSLKQNPAVEEEVVKATG